MAGQALPGPERVAPDPAPPVAAPATTLVRLDWGTGQSKRFIRLPALAEMYRPKLAIGRRVVAARVGQQLRLIDPATDKIRATVNLHDPTGGVAADGETIWATESPFGRLLRIDPGF